MTETTPRSQSVDPQAPESRRIPFQLLLMMAIVLSLMLIVWFKLASTDFKESHKAQLTAEYYLDALGKSPIDKLGAELHPEVRRFYQPKTLEALFQQLSLDKPLTIHQMRDEQYQKEPQQWSWRFDLEQQGKTFPLLLSVRQPQEQAIARRWRVYALCRPDLDLTAQAQLLLKGPRSALQQLAGINAFQPLSPENWKLVSTSPPSLIVPGKSQKLELIWQSEPNGKLGCSYKLSASRLR